ncbi:MAG TPA: aldo/keto reductase [Candidatus Hodarchaeales archaeon]|nr:aldo/keto reductase [Candidatus Hodarchaeales archaeon]
MKKRKCHAFEVPEVGIGTSNTFDVRSTRDYDDRRDLLKQALGLGINFVDTAPMYGEAEKVLGKTLQNLDFMLSTKVWTSGKRAGHNQIIQSFAFLQKPYIDFLFIHALLDCENHIETIERMQDDNKIGLAGISHFQSSAFPEMVDVMETERVQVVQVPYNIYEKKAEEMVFPVAEKLGLGVMAISPFNQGALFRFKRRSKVDMEPLEVVGIKTWSQALLAWILSDDRVSCVIHATSNINHLLENIQASKIPKLDDDLRTHIEKEATRCLV